jgi:hypothetical protein
MSFVDIPITRICTSGSKSVMASDVVKDLLIKYVGEDYLTQKTKVVIDPFAGNHNWATYSNDINPSTTAEHHMDAAEFLTMLKEKGVKGDFFLIDPPWCKTTLEWYKTKDPEIDKRMIHQGNYQEMKQVRTLVTELANDGAICFYFGWTSLGMGKHGGWTTKELIMWEPCGSRPCVHINISQFNESSRGVKRKADLNIKTNLLQSKRSRDGRFNVLK